MKTDEQRFWAKVDPCRTDGCMIWTGYCTKKGYGQFGFKNQVMYAHRFAYQYFVGPIPDGMEIDHVKTKGCTNRNCTWSEHLEPVTHADNIRRGRSHTREKTHCPKGHPYDEVNTRIWHGRRWCRTCERARGH